jgi:hypothetical protein
MNDKQRYVVILAIIVLCGMLLMPPWLPQGYEPIFSAAGSRTLDWSRLGLQLAIVLCAAAGFYVALSKTAVSSEGPQPRCNLGMKLFVLALLVLLATAGGWAFISMNQKAETLEHLQNQQLAETQSRVRQKSVAAQEERQRLNHTSSLGEPKKWIPIKEITPGVTATLLTCWKQDCLFYRLHLTATAKDSLAALEFARAANHEYVLELINTEQQAVFQVRIEPSDLEQMKTPKGQVYALSTPQRSHPMRQSGYESACAWKLTLEQG